MEMFGVGPGLRHLFGITLSSSKPWAQGARLSTLPPPDRGPNRPKGSRGVWASRQRLIGPQAPGSQPRALLTWSSTGQVHSCQKQERFERRGASRQWFQGPGQGTEGRENSSGRPEAPSRGAARQHSLEGTYSNHRLQGVEGMRCEG